MNARLLYLAIHLASAIFYLTHCLVIYEVCGQSRHLVWSYTKSLDNRNTKNNKKNKKNKTLTRCLMARVITKNKNSNSVQTLQKINIYSTKTESISLFHKNVTPKNTSPVQSNHALHTGIKLTQEFFTG